MSWACSRVAAITDHRVGVSVPAVARRHDHVADPDDFEHMLADLYVRGGESRAREDVTVLSQREVHVHLAPRQGVFKLELSTSEVLGAVVPTTVRLIVWDRRSSACLRTLDL